MSIKKAAHNILDLDTQKEWEGEFTFICAADCQLGMEWSCKGNNANGFGQGNGYEPHYDNCTWYNEIRWCNSFVNAVNSMQPKPKFAIICGDILDAWPAAWGHVRDRQYKDWVEIFSKLDIPLICVCGNHDIGNRPTKAAVARYRAEFGDDWFTFVSGGVFFIVINSQYYEHSDNVPEIAAEQSAWLEEQLKISKSGTYKHSVLFQHIPWFLEKPDEPKVYYNFPQPLRENMLKKFAEAGISKIFCGHYHRNAGGWYNDTMELIVTSALGLQQGKDLNGYRIVNVSESQVTHQYVLIDNIAAPESKGKAG